MYAKVLKRLFDFLLSLIGLIVLSPVLLILTVLGAVKKVREIRKSGNVPVTVAFKAGNYGTLTARLTKEDTGTADVPITYCAYGDGDVIFNNGVLIDDDVIDLSGNKATRKICD